MAAKRGRGGPRAGSGRPSKPKSEVRRNRVVVMLTDRELTVLKKRAARIKQPLGTTLYGLVKRSLRRN